MDTDALRWFQEVADGVTVTEVSELTRTSQSGVSRALARLEAEVGAPLLRRSGRTLRMTEAGVVFKRHVDALIHHLDDGLAAVQQVIDPESGTVTLAYESWLGTTWVPSLVSGFRAEHPSVRFTLVPRHADTIATLRSRGDIDLELTTSRPAPSTHGWHVVARESLHLVVSAEDPLASSSGVALHTLSVSEAGFVALRAGSSLRNLADDLCAEAGFTPRIDFECDDVPTVLGFVAAGLGVAILPLQDSHPESRPGPESGVQFLSITDVPASLEIGIAWALEHRLLPAAQTFLAHVRRPPQNKVP
ncbi:LysR family transcriptional regulator [Tessaracoccus antarcticus]|nr:LysR family transcriptional regulator [Tessaracoccus antarcticus]